jgi:hypothetical protein
MPSAMPGPGSDRSESEDVWSRFELSSTNIPEDKRPLTYY